MTQDIVLATTQHKVAQGEVVHTKIFDKRLESYLVLFLALVALLPRVMLASTLDIVTDEVVYITAAKKDFALLASLQLGSPQWNYNYEHPPLVKFLIGAALKANDLLGTPLGALLAARLPSILAGTSLVVALYWLGRAPFGRTVALSASLCLAVSPWLVYFGALAYLDTTMTAFITLATLLTWHALRRPWLYPVVSLLLGLGAVSKYTALLAIPGIVIFTGYYYFLVRPTLPMTQRPRIPWCWWLTSLVLVPAIFLLADVAIWPSPVALLMHSLRYEWEHAYNGHIIFLAGRNVLHAPLWTALYIVCVKLSVFVTVPAAFFLVYGIYQVIRFQQGKRTVDEVMPVVFLSTWLLATLFMFSLLKITVGTHYDLPLAAPVALAGAAGMAICLRSLVGTDVLHSWAGRVVHRSLENAATGVLPRLNHKSALHRPLPIALLFLLLVGPHVIGLVTIQEVEGYTSELFRGENAVLQVAYPGYREATQWIAAHSQGIQRVGLVAFLGTLNNGNGLDSWYDYNRSLPERLILSEAHPGTSYDQYDYLIWPMHLTQRGYTPPDEWRNHTVQRIMGGSTIYCYILTRSQAKGTTNDYH